MTRTKMPKKKKRAFPAPGDYPEAYAALCEENESLRKQLRNYESKTKKRPKREPNAYQKAWKGEYPREVTHAKSEAALSVIVLAEGLTDPKTNTAFKLQPYSRRYSDALNVAPNPKAGEALAPGDRKVFMQNVSCRAKAALAVLQQKSSDGAPPPGASERVIKHGQYDVVLPPSQGAGGGDDEEDDEQIESIASRAARGPVACPDAAMEHEADATLFSHLAGFAKDLKRSTGDAYTFRSSEECLQFLKELAFCHNCWDPSSARAAGTMEEIAPRLFHYIQQQQSA